MIRLRDSLIKMTMWLFAERGAEIWIQMNSVWIHNSRLAHDTKFKWKGKHDNIKKYFLILNQLCGNPASPYSLGRFCIDRKWKHPKCFVALGWLSRRLPVITFTTVEEAFNFTSPPFFPLGLISVFVHLSALSFFISATQANESIVYDDSESNRKLCVLTWKWTGDLEPVCASSTTAGEKRYSVKTN